MEVSLLFSQPLQRLAEGQFTAGYKRSAVGHETEDSGKNPHDVVAVRLAISSRENLAIQPAARIAGKGLLHDVAHCNQCPLAKNSPLDILRQVKSST